MRKYSLFQTVDYSRKPEFITVRESVVDILTDQVNSCYIDLIDPDDCGNEIARNYAVGGSEGQRFWTYIKNGDDGFYALDITQKPAPLILHQGPYPLHQIDKFYRVDEKDARFIFDGSIQEIINEFLERSFIPQCIWYPGMDDDAWHEEFAQGRQRDKRAEALFKQLWDKKRHFRG